MRGGTQNNLSITSGHQNSKPTKEEKEKGQLFFLVDYPYGNKPQRLNDKS